MFKIGDRVKALPSITQQDGCDSQFLINKIGIIQRKNEKRQGRNIWINAEYRRAFAGNNSA